MNNRQRVAVKGGTTSEMLALIFAVLCAIYGVQWGLFVGQHYGILGKTICGIGGAFGGLVAFLLALFLGALVLEPFSRFWRWWRPDRPPCENGICHAADYTFIEIAASAVQQPRGLSPYGDRCKCGHVYAGGFGYGMRNRFVRVLPDGTIRPYLKHSFLGRWKADDGSGIGEPGWDERLDRATEPLEKAEIPGWGVLCIFVGIFGGIAFTTIWAEGGVRTSAGVWMIAGSAFFGLACGCAMLFRDRKAKRQRNGG